MSDTLAAIPPLPLNLVPWTFYAFGFVLLIHLVWYAREAIETFLAGHATRQEIARMESETRLAATFGHATRVDVEDLAERDASKLPSSLPSPYGSYDREFVLHVVGEWFRAQPKLSNNAVIKLGLGEARTGGADFPAVTSWVLGLRGDLGYPNLSKKRG